MQSKIEINNKKVCPKNVIEKNGKENFRNKIVQLAFNLFLLILIIIIIINITI